jgi:hypothetical protein
MPVYARLSGWLYRHEREGRDTLTIVSVTSHWGGRGQKRRCRHRTIGSFEAILTAQISRQAGQAGVNGDDDEGG